MRGRYLIASLLMATGCADFAGIGDPQPLADAGASCVVGGFDLCVYGAPQHDLEIDTDVTLYTLNDCDFIYNYPLGHGSCVIYARNIAVNATVTARGPLPLVFAATERIEVNGTVDLSSGFAMNQYVAAAASNGACMAPTIAAAGAGGSFGGKGGNGGTSTTDQVAVATPALALPGYLRGGCGGGGAISELGGSGLFKDVIPSGGAVALVSAGALVVGPAGRVTANGAGGNGAVDMSAVASGGGSGGMIQLAGRTITIEGTVVANGGGGGEGVDGTNSGSFGASGTLTTMRAAGGAGHPGGADGGAGGAGTTPDGLPGMAGSVTGIYADGAGGGGVGFIVISGDLTMSGTISPPPVPQP